MAMDQYHFTFQDGQWKLTKANAERAALVFGDATKEKALADTIEYMIKHEGSLRIHGLDGKIQEERTYPRSADPRRSKG